MPLEAELAQHRGRRAAGGLGLLQLAGRALDAQDPAHGRRHREVALARDLPVDPERLLGQRVAPGELPLRRQQIGEIEQGAGQKRVRAAALAPDRERPAEGRLGRVELSLRGQHGPEVVPALRGLLARGTRPHQALSQRLPVQGIGLGVPAETLVDGPDGAPDRRGDDRVRDPAGVHLLDPFRERVHHRRLPRAALPRVCRLEQVHQEAADRHRLGLAPRGPVPLPHDAGDARDERHDRRRQHRHAEPVAADEPRGDVAEGRRPRGHRLVLEVALEVEGERVGGLVAPVAVPLDRLDHDPVEVAAQLRGEARPAWSAGAGPSSWRYPPRASRPGGSAWGCRRFPARTAR